MGSINQQYEQMVEQIRQALSEKSDLPIVALGEFLTEDALQTAENDLQGWQHVRMWDQYAYAEHEEIALQDEIRDFVARASGAAPLRESNKRFGHRDFTMLHDEQTQKAGLLGLFFLDEWDESRGGSIVFMREGEMLGRFTPARNTLLIVNRLQGVQYFVHYVNHHAGKHTFKVISA